MTLTILEAKLNKAGYYMVADQDLCEILVSNNNAYPNHFRKCYSLHGWTLQEIHDDVIGELEEPVSNTDITCTAREYREIQAAIKEMEAQAETLKQVMIKEMDARQADELTAGEYTIRYTLYESSRIDTAKLKAAGLYDDYSKRTTSTRFQVA